MILLDTLGDFLSNPAIAKATLPALWETIVMVGLSGVFTVVLGLPLGVVLFVTKPGGMAEHRGLNFVLSSIVVNITRSFPYAILMISLTIGAVPFFARLVETALRDVPAGKLDAAHAMGSTRMQSIRKVLIPEAMPTLVDGVTTTLVTLVGYSTMAGLIGGGGLGRLAYNYGYQRFQPDVMIFLVVLIIVIVQIIQFAGDRISKAVDHR